MVISICNLPLQVQQNYICCGFITTHGLVTVCNLENRVGKWSIIYFWYEQLNHTCSRFTFNYDFLFMFQRLWQSVWMPKVMAVLFPRVCQLSCIDMSKCCTKRRNLIKKFSLWSSIWSWFVNTKLSNKKNLNTKNWLLFTSNSFFTHNLLIVSTRFYFHSIQRETIHRK